MFTTNLIQTKNKEFKWPTDREERWREHCMTKFTMTSIWRDTIWSWYVYKHLLDQFTHHHPPLFFSQFFQWYTLSKSLPEKYQSKFLSLEKPDDITLSWLEQAKQLSSNLWLQLWHLAARLFLGFFMTQTSINGYATETIFNSFLIDLFADCWNVDQCSFCQRNNSRIYW